MIRTGGARVKFPGALDITSPNPAPVGVKRNQKHASVYHEPLYIRPPIGRHTSARNAVLDAHHPLLSTKSPAITVFGLRRLLFFCPGHVPWDFVYLLEITVSFSRGKVEEREKGSRQPRTSRDLGDAPSGGHRAPAPARDCCENVSQAPGETSRDGKCKSHARNSIVPGLRHSGGSN